MTIPTTKAAALDEKRMAEVVAHAKKCASYGTHCGKDSDFPYLKRCKHDDYPTGTRIIFTRDSGHHSSGWMKNPDFERCLHLSLSPRPPAVILPGSYVLELDKKMKWAWIRAFFGDQVRYLWAESPKTGHGKRLSVWHWRLFCDEAWQPILPVGEVYSTEATSVGWRSASQVMEEDGVIISSPVDPT